MLTETEMTMSLWPKELLSKTEGPFVSPGTSLAWETLTGALAARITPGTRNAQTPPL